MKRACTATVETTAQQRQRVVSMGRMIEPLLKGARPNKPFYFDRFDIILLHLVKELIVKVESTNETHRGQALQSYIAEADDIKGTLLRPVTNDDLEEKLATSKLVIVGEHHPITTTRQKNYSLLKRLDTPKGETTIALEALPTYAQKSIDEYVHLRKSKRWLAGQLTRHQFNKDYNPLDAMFNMENYKAFLHHAQRHQNPLLAINKRNRDCYRRDEHMAFLLNNEHATAPDKKLFALVGSHHAHPAHLPRLLRERYKLNGKDVCVLVNDHEAVYRATKATTGSFFQDTRYENVFYALHATPMSIVKSYLSHEGLDQEDLLDEVENLAEELRTAFTAHFNPTTRADEKGTYEEGVVVTKKEGVLWDYIQTRPLQEGRQNSLDEALPVTIPEADYSRSFYHYKHNYLYLCPDDLLHAKVFFSPENLEAFMKKGYHQAA